MHLLLLLMTLCNAWKVILAEFDIINEDIGDIHLHGRFGRLPLKYIPLSENDKKATDKVGQLIDFLPLVPKIDPLVLPEVPAFGIDVPFLLLSGKVYLKNVRVSGVKQLQLNEVEMRLINIRTDLNITIPHIHFEGDFYLQATLSFMPLRFSCHISVNLFDVEVMVTSGGYKVKAFSVGEVLQIDSADVKVDILNAMVNITNMVTGEEEEEDLITPTTQLFSRSAMDSNDDMLDGVLKSVLDFANKQLLKIPIGFFEEYLLSDTY